MITEEQKDKDSIVASRGEPGKRGSVWILDRSVHNYFSYRNGYVKRYLVAPVGAYTGAAVGTDSLEEALAEFKRRTGL